MNLHCGASRTGELFDVEAVICGLDASIVALQETWLPEEGADPVAAAARGLPAQLLRLPLCRLPGLASIGIPADRGPGHIGIAVLTTLPITGYEFVRLGLAPGDKIPRYAQIVWLGLDQRNVLRFVNVHLTYRPLSPLQLLRLRHRLGDYSGPTVIAGDLNMPRPLASLVAGSTPAVEGRTWPAEHPVLQLDHVLASAGIECVQEAVLPHFGSDHLPVWARLRLSAPTSAAGESASLAADYARADPDTGE